MKDLRELARVGEYVILLKTTGMPWILRYNSMVLLVYFRELMALLFGWDWVCTLELPALAGARPPPWEAEYNFCWCPVSIHCWVNKDTGERRLPICLHPAQGLNQKSVGCEPSMLITALWHTHLASLPVTRGGLWYMYVGISTNVFHEDLLPEWSFQNPITVLLRHDPLPQVYCSIMN